MGIYLADQKNNIEHIVKNFNAPCQWHVVQKWIAIGENPQGEEVRKATVLKIQEGAPKFVLLNNLLSKETLDYDFVFICDDDISLPPDFLETYLDLVINYGFAMAQPARTHNSYIDHPFVEQLDGLKARRTRFIEIGPLFSVRRDLFSVIFPFDESSYMGWGYDLRWPCLVEKQRLRMGIVDAVPIDHSIRKPVVNYKYDEANNSMKNYLMQNLHLSKEEAFRILESYA